MSNKIVKFLLLFSFFGCNTYDDEDVALVRNGLIDPLLLVVECIYPHATHISETLNRCQKRAEELNPYQRAVGDPLFYCVHVKDLRKNSNTTLKLD